MIKISVQRTAGRGKARGLDGALLGLRGEEVALIALALDDLARDKRVNPSSRVMAAELSGRFLEVFDYENEI